MKLTISANRGQTPESFLTCSESEFEPRSALHHHIPLAQLFSVGPFFWEIPNAQSQQLAHNMAHRGTVTGVYLGRGTKL